MHFWCLHMKARGPKFLENSREPCQESQHGHRFKEQRNLKVQRLSGKKFSRWFYPYESLLKTKGLHKNVLTKELYEASQGKDVETVHFMCLQNCFLNQGFILAFSSVRLKQYTLGLWWGKYNVSKALSTILVHTSCWTNTAYCPCVLVSLWLCSHKQLRPACTVQSLPR